MGSCCVAYALIHFNDWTESSEKRNTGVVFQVQPLRKIHQHVFLCWLSLNMQVLLPRLRMWTMASSPKVSYKGTTAMENV